MKPKKKKLLDILIIKSWKLKFDSLKHENDFTIFSFKFMVTGWPIPWNEVDFLNINFKFKIKFAGDPLRILVI